MKKEWGGQAISAGPGHEDLLPADIWARAAITGVREPYMFHDRVHKHMFTEYFLFFGSNPMKMKEFEVQDYPKRTAEYPILNKESTLQPADMYRRKNFIIQHLPRRHCGGFDICL
jgi:hypothetical protein